MIKVLKNMNRSQRLFFVFAVIWTLIVVPNLIDWPLDSYRTSAQLARQFDSAECREKANAPISDFHESGFGNITFRGKAVLLEDQCHELSYEKGTAAGLIDAKLMFETKLELSRNALSHALTRAFAALVFWLFPIAAFYGVWKVIKWIQDGKKVPNP